jgi:peptide/nickel transport system permease protein
VIAQRLPLTLQLALGGLVFVLAVGFPLGVAAGSLQHSGRWRPLTSAFAGGTALVGAFPEYITGAFLTFVFSLSLQLLPVQGGSGFASMILPTVAVGAAPAAILARLVRNETVGVLSQEYIVTAAAKRLSRLQLLVRHVLPNVATSTLTLGGLILVGLLGGTVITENVFNINGLGTGIVQGILHNDYPTVQGILLVLGALAVCVNLVVDLALGLLDPRVLNRPVS